MTADDRFGGSVSEWLHDRAGDGAPDYLDVVLGRTAATRQRPGWTLVAWWLPVSVTAPTSPRSLPRLGRLVLVGLLILALAVAAIVAVGSRERRLPPPFGLARNGIVVTAIGGQLYTVDPVSGTTTALAAKSPDGTDFGPMFSRDGTKLLFVRGVLDKGVEIVVANADGTGAKVVSPAVEGIDQVDWSPDGTRLVYLSRVLDQGRINVVNADGTDPDTLDVGGPANQVSWLAPDGAYILFRREHLSDADPKPAIFVVRPDGTGLRDVTSRPALDDADFQDISGSPDGTKVAYRESSLRGYFQIHILDLRTGIDQILPSPRDAPAQTSPAFSPDGTHVAYLRFHLGQVVQLVVAPLDGTSTGVDLPLRGDLGSDGPTINNYFFTPDGTAVVANELNSRTEWLLPIDGSPGTVLARGTQPYDALSTIQRLAP
jgi:Tol biopolymer transport system component